MVKDKVEICQIQLSNFNSIQGIGNFPLYNKARYNALSEIIKRNIHPNFQHFLAQPVEEGDTITFYGIQFYEKPIRFSELIDAEKDKYSVIKEETIREYENAIILLQKNGKSEDYEYLDKALKFIIDDFIYCYDEKIVLCVWGMKPKTNPNNFYGEYALDVFPEIKNIIKYNIVFDSGIHGNISGSREFKISINKGSKFKIEDLPIVTANEGYVFDKWSDDSVLNDESISKNHILTAQYIKIENEVPNEIEPEIHEEPIYEKAEPLLHKVFFRVRSEDGKISNEYIKEIEDGSRITENDIPYLEEKKGYKISDWDVNPLNQEVYHNQSYEIIYNKISKIPWYRRLWNWLINFFRTNRFFKWLFWILLLFFLIWLLSWLFKGCDHSNPIPSPIDKKPWVNTDPRVGSGGGIYDPGNPYSKTPTPPEYSEILPPNEGEMPPFDDDKIIRKPGKPVIVGNRLNILLENQDKTILEFAKDFKQKYPSEEYKVVYYDNVVKRMQIEIPEEKRENIKEEIPTKFAPKYQLFVFDESLFESNYIPNDPAFKNPKKSWHLRSIETNEAWNITLGSKKITVAIIDNGFNLSHPELSQKVVMPYNVWTHSNDITSQEIDHGTHVAGIALALANNEKGLCGVAPKCSFMPVQVANDEGLMTTTSVLDGILYALYQGADVINISLGLEFVKNIPINQQHELQNNHFKEEERLWNKVMEISDKHKATLVIAAGNENLLAGINPMNRPKNFIVVSAVNKNNNSYKKAGFSNYGQFTTISAPGVDIYSTIGDNEYQIMSGTSMAAPIVTGVVALMKSINKNLTSEQIICILKNTGKQANNKIGNVIQINEALKYMKQGKVNDCKQRPSTPSTGDVQILLSWDNYNDLDLVCKDPKNERIWFKKRKSVSGGTLEIDMNVKYPDNQKPIENIFWPVGKAPNGKYQISLIYYKRHIDQDLTNYKIHVNYGNKMKDYTGVINSTDKVKYIGGFILGNQKIKNEKNEDKLSFDNTKKK